MTDYLKTFLMPLPYFLLASVLTALTKAPLGADATGWLTAVAAACTSVGSILLNPEHLMTMASAMMKVLKGDAP